MQLSWIHGIIRSAHVVKSRGVIKHPSVEEAFLDGAVNLWLMVKVFI